MMVRGTSCGCVSRALANLLVGVLVLGAFGGLALGDLRLRSGERIVEPIEVISMEGITVRGATTRLIGWERIERVEGERADDAAHFMAMAERAWRARIRLTRGDVALAEPLLEALFAETRGRAGSVALIAAEGLVRCRLARADVPGAVVPWLEAVRLREAGAVVRGSEDEVELLDRATLLMPALPPFFSPEQAAVVVSGLGVDPLSLPDDGASRALLGWYRAAAAHDAGGSDGGGGMGALADEQPEGAGVRFVADLVLARTAGSAEARAVHRSRLRLGLEQDIDTWREAWRRAGLGMSYLAEGDDENALLGVLELLHLPARFGTTQPQLAGLALAHASAALERLGYGDTAERLRDELRTKFAQHPALVMLPGGGGSAVGAGDVGDGLGDDPLEFGGEGLDFDDEGSAAR